MAIFLVLIILIQGFLELVSITSIYPLFAVIADTNIIKTNEILNYLYINLGFNNINYFLVFLTFSSFLIITFRTLFSLFNYYLLTRFVRMRTHVISLRLLASFVNQPYMFFINKHSSELNKTILSEVEQVIQGCLQPGIDLIAQSTITIAIISAVLLINPLITFLPLLGIIIFYSIIVFLLRKKTFNLGESRNSYNAKRFKVIQEVFAGIKEVKLSNNEDTYLNEFKLSSLNYSKLFIKLSLFRDSPRYLLELISVGALFSVILSLLFNSSKNINDILPSISVFGFAGIRILPSFQKLYQAILIMEFNLSALVSLKNNIINLKNKKLRSDNKFLKLTKNLKISNVYYSYPNQDGFALKNINMNIKAKTSIGIVGATGAGKSTILDIIVGLLTPDSGDLIVDGKKLIDKNIRTWQKSIGYVSQDIFISDNTISQNIALGINEKDIDYKRLEKAAKQADIFDFITKELPNKFETYLGERGIRISGGQKQRIGIARALYLDPEVIILDEATSSLDNQTERKIIDSLKELTYKKTIIMIAHRLSTVEGCDMIYFLEKGEITLSGKFIDLLNNKKFKNFANR